MEALVDSLREEALDSLALEDSPELVDSLELEELEDGQELEEVTLHREAREDTHLKEAREDTHHKEVKEAIPLKEAKEDIPLKEVKVAIHLKEARVAILLREAKVLPLLLLPGVDPTPRHLSQSLTSPPRPRAPLDPAPPTLTPAVLANITRSDTTRTAPWPRSRRESTRTTSTPSRWSTGGQLTRASGPGLPPCSRMADSSVAAPSSPGSTSSPPPTASLSKS